ncbi:2-methylcitrate dehydratase PrpD [Rhizobiales bacterium GAS113]|nr:2-methylcitrate dehydratase PrpD [Rhizobiales bacterium GAS113]
MTALTSGVVPASILLTGVRPPWLDAWGRFAHRLGFADLPEQVVARCKLVLLDTIGVIACGMQEKETKALVGRLAAVNGTSNSGAPVIGAGRRLPAAISAFLNGTAGTMLELDEGNQYARGHPGIHVVPAALASAELRGAPGTSLLAAIALGYEIGARIGIASKLRVTMHPHGTWGSVGAAMSVAKLNGADPQQLVETINVASTLGLATSRRTMLEGGTVRNSYAGFANQLGLTAWDLVASGFVGETDGVGTVYGSVIADDFRPEEMTAELGERWEIARNYFKRHAACRYTHGALDALADIVKQAGGRLDPTAIASIEVDTYVWAAQLDSPEPRNMLAAKFSLPFALATAITHGGAGVEAFRDSALQDSATRELARRVSVREDAALTAQLPGLRPARLRICLRDGRVFEAQTLTNKGDTEDPYPDDEVRLKFRELAEPVFGKAQAQHIADAVDGIERARDIGELGRLLAASAQEGR